MFNQPGLAKVVLVLWARVCEVSDCRFTAQMLYVEVGGKLDFVAFLYSADGAKERPLVEGECV